MIVEVIRGAGPTYGETVRLGETAVSEPAAGLLVELVIEAERSCVLPDAVGSEVDGVLLTTRSCKNSRVWGWQVGLDEIHQVLVDQAGWYLTARGASALEPARHRQRISAGVALEGIPQIAVAGRPSRKRIVDLVSKALRSPPNSAGVGTFNRD